MNRYHALAGILCALIASQPHPTRAAVEPGFTNLFDGQTLTGWKAAQPGYWSVEDGAITARITPEHPLKENLYLIWTGGDLADFELKLKHRVFGSPGINCGFQFRSRELSNHDVAGYQVDNNLDTDWLVRLYDEHGRHTLAMRGERSVFDDKGEATRTKIPEADGAPWFKLENWHEYHLVCQGPKITLKVDGRLAAEVIDNDPSERDLYGILGLQLHTGPPTTAQFKDIQLKVLTPASAVRHPGAGLKDKTLVAWVSPANLEQRGGSVLTLDDTQAHFDGLVFGELQPGKWMAGSDGFNRTWKEQGTWGQETADSNTLVQVAATYRGREVRLYRNGAAYAHYTLAGPPLEFTSTPAVVIGRRHLDVGEPGNSFTGRIKDLRIYDRALSDDEIKSLSPGDASALPPWAWWSFPDEGLRERTGRYNEIKTLGNVRLENGWLVVGGKGATVIATASPEAATGLPVPKNWDATTDVPDAVVQSARLLRERLLADPYRPGYHFCVPEDMGMPGDPNGAFYAGGRYHLMYLYDRRGVGFCWGHISSSDLLHWRHHPDAIGPGAGDEGCFSGGAFVDDDGSAYLSYWMLWGAKGIGLAKALPPAFETWTKSDHNPIIRSTDWGITERRDAAGNRQLLGSADPSNIWKKNGRYYVLTGNLLVLEKIGRAPDAPISEQGDRLYLWASDDLQNWEYLHSFYERKPEWTDRSEDNMCPSFLPLPSRADGGPASGKHLLLFIAHNKGCQYYVGEYRDDRFYPERHGRMTWVDSTYFAPEALIDAAGRQIMWAWLTDNPPGEKAKGWSGVYGLPRSLWLGNDGELRLAPVKELETLRGPERSWEAGPLAAATSRALTGLNGNSCELQVRLRVPTGAKAGIKVRASSDGEEQTLLYYDPSSNQLVFDSTRSGVAGRKVVEKAPLQLGPNEDLELRVFIDQSVVEVFANERQAIGRRVYPGRADSLGLELFAEGGEATVVNARGWNISPTNPY